MDALTTCSREKDSISTTILSLEKSALEKWNNGDPSGYLNIYDKKITYFDPFTEFRIDGLEKMTELYEQIRGQIHVDNYDMLNVRIQSAKDMAVLTYNLVSYSGTQTDKWNCTEVYKLNDEGNWKIVHSHWSFTRPAIRQ